MHIIIELTKYLLIILMGAYSYFAYRVLVNRSKKFQDKSYKMMTFSMFILHFTGYFTLYLQAPSDKLLILYLCEVVLLVLVLTFYTIFYPNISRLLLLNMLLLLSIGFIVITRLSFDKAVRQVIVSGLAFGIAFLVPAVIQRLNKLRYYGWIYGVVGIALLILVLLVGKEKHGATSWLSVLGMTFQPMEFVKVLFVLCIAALFDEGLDFKRICAVTIMAAVTVLALVFQRDLGAALIFFVTYVFMLYVATAKPLYLLSGLAMGSVAAWVAYQLFDHVKVRVMAWQNPFGYIDNEGYQISQSLFAIGTGGWFGMGLLQGLPTSIPVVDSDFIFSAIAEELGGLFAICMILIYVNCFIVLINISLKHLDSFYRLIALGFSVMFGFQVFLSIGGVIKFIPSTGVTLPLISYGGSSIVASIIMFMVIQGIFHRGNIAETQKVEDNLVGDIHDEEQ
ncbi:MAG: FtsW/RodA/SpoVE family cell cycle protein [Clostridiales bacterium]|nr:FtsW/RodA/SpoVE family cell cycle protein [Clostridiales bacterium]